MVPRFVSLVFVAVLLALPLAALGQSQDPAKGVDYRLIIACPGAEQLTSECPIRVVDGADALGDPSLAMDPFNPTNLILASLHGSGDNSGAPSPKSRSGQVFTTHTSTNHGVGWTDKPFYPPGAVSARAYGEHPQVAITHFGQAFIGSLYSVPGNPAGRFDYVIAAQKFKSLGDINNNQDVSGDYNADYIGSYYSGSRINQFWYLFNPVTDNMTMVWHESATPYSQPRPEGLPQIAKTMDGVIPRSARTPSPVVPDLPGLPGLPSAQARDAQQANGSARSMIGLSWTTSVMRDDYEPWEYTIGPCQSSTNPVISEGLLYIGCVVAKDQGVFEWDPSLEPGTIAMFRFDPDGGEPQYIGPTPITGGAPKLGVRSDGRMALATADVDDNGTLRLDVSYGTFYNSTQTVIWNGIHSYGHNMPALDATVKRVAANVQDITYREYSGVVHLIVKQVLGPDTAGLMLQPSIRKSIVAVDEKYGYLDDHHFDMGNPLNRSQDSTLLTMSDAVFNDITDDFLQLHPGPFRYNDRNLGRTYQREFFAIGDYGVILFGEVIEITDLRFAPAVPPPPPPPPPVAAPVAATIQTIAPVAALTASGLLARNFATAKRKNLVKADKKR